MKKLCEDGFFVYGFDIKQENEFERKFAGLKARYMCGDITDPKARETAINTICQGDRELNVLVNTVGVAPSVRSDLLVMTEVSYDRVMNINAKALLFLTQYAANRMKNNSKTDGVRGYIVNISSMSAYTSSVNRGEYCISKAGVSMITTLFADRLAEYDIPVNEIRPGIIDTAMTAGVKEKYNSLIADGILPFARWGQPEDVAECVSALVGGAFRYTTGQSIDVDGGFHIRRL